QGKTLVSELSEIENPEKYIENLKNSINLFKKANEISKKYPNKCGKKVPFYSICFNVFSAYYEYNLLLEKFDEKHAVKILDYLNDALKQCEIIESENGKTIIKIFEKLTETLISSINKIKRETEKRDISKKGNGIGRRVSLDAFSMRSRKKVEKYIKELDDLLIEIEILHIKKIIEFEKERINEIKPENEEILMPKTFWNLTHDYITNVVAKFWKIIITIGLILATLVGIIKNWIIISNL
ncbi:MAG: hypothetical protein MUP85_18395, partial [Candidatus Lokiarchaeota archaeon]|nr:hypothetical protein [Candidatus Lokiarchaeota archaeon]